MFGRYHSGVVNRKEPAMNRKTFLESARTGAAVALGIAGVFGATFAVTSLVAQAEEQTPAPAAAPAAPSAEAPAATPAPQAAPRAESIPAPRRPGRPEFKDLDTNGDGSISQSEFEAFHPAPPPQFEGDARPRGDWREDDRAAPRDPGREPRRERYREYDDRSGPPPPPDDRFGPPPPPNGRYGDNGPPPRGRGDRDGYGYDDRGGGDCEHRGGPRPRGGQRGEFGPPPPGAPNGFGPDDNPPRPPRYPDYY